jgi:hypothetical protein
MVEGPTGEMTYRIGPGEDCDYPGMPELVNDEVLQPGDVVEITATPPEKLYKSAIKYIYPVVGGTAPITFRGISDEHGNRPLFDGTGKVMEAPRAFFEFYGSALSPATPNDGAWVLENLEFAHAINSASDMNACAARNSNAASLRVKNCKIWNCCMGVMSSEASGETIIEDCDIGFNGYGDGHSHNIYCMGQRFQLYRSRVHNSIVGQNVKTRSRYVDIRYNTIFASRDGEIGIIQAGDGTPEGAALTSHPGSNAIVVDNEITTRTDRSGGNKTAVVVFGQDMGTVGRNGTLYFHGNKIYANSADNNHIKLAGPTTSLDARHNKFIGSKNILYQEVPAIAVTGQLNWAEPDAAMPEQFVEPAVYSFTMGEEFTADAEPGRRNLHSSIQVPENFRDWNDQGGLGFEWDAVAGALFYRIWRYHMENGKAMDNNTVWGGATEPRYVDIFQHVGSTSSKKHQYVYRVQAVDLNGSQSAQSSKWIKEHGQPGFAG